MSAPTSPGWLSRAPVLVLAVLLLPVLAGVAGTLLPALGRHPGLSDPMPPLAAFRDLLAAPGLGRSVALTVTTGLAATGLSLGLCIAILAAWYGTRSFRLVRRLLSPLLSVPHAAAALALAFLIAPSGWIARILSPWATGWTRPPDILTVNDPLGLALVAGLVLKELPFLLLMSLAALPATDPERSRLAAESLGYGRMAAFLHTVAPRLYAQIRLPVLAVLAYAASSVEMALILGPTTPPTLPVRVLQWFRDPDLALQMQAAAGAVLQALVVAALLAGWSLAERGTRALLCRLRGTGRRWGADRAARIAAMILALGAAGAVILGLLGQAIWSVAGFWSFASPLPAALTARAWTGAAPGLADHAGTTVLIALCAMLAALVLAVVCLEAETRGQRGLGQRALWLLYLPLLLPEVCFLLGLQILALRLGTEASWPAVALVHVVFVFPYVYLSLAGPWRAFDPRLALAARSLGASEARVFWRVRLPVMTAPLLTAAAVGATVSAGQYLSTVLIGAGRVATLTTEAVALSSGGDRRLTGVYAISQTILPFLAFSLALVLPTILFRNRRAMRGTR